MDGGAPSHKTATQAGRQILGAGKIAFWPNKERTPKYIKGQILL